MENELTEISISFDNFVEDKTKADSPVLITLFFRNLQPNLCKSGFKALEEKLQFAIILRYW